MDIVSEQKKAYDYINTTINKNKKLSHSYLIETNDYPCYIEFVKKMIIDILCLNIDDDSLKQKIKMEVENDNYPDVKYIKADGSYVKKEQLLLLEKEFSKKSMLDNKLIYVIEEANKLNDSSANTILKFLEEPNPDIIAILVTSNKYEVLETIVSRCQIISLINKDTINVDNDYIFDFINDLHSETKLMTNFDDYYEKLFSNKNLAKESIVVIETVFLDFINDKLEDSNLIENIKKYSVDTLIKYVIVFEKQKDNLKYNLNMKLWFNNLIVELVEVK